MSFGAVINKIICKQVKIIDEISPVLDEGIVSVKKDVLYLEI